MAQWLRNTETLFKLGLLAFFLLLIWTGSNYPEKSRLFPEIIGGITVILILISCIQDFMKPKDEKKQEEAKRQEFASTTIREEKLRWVREVEEQSEEDAGFKLLEEGLRRRRLFQSALLILVSIGIGYLGGFLVTVPFYFLAFGLLHGEKKHALRYMMVALGTTLVTYFLFGSLMGLPLLRGWLWDLG